MQIRTFACSSCVLGFPLFRHRWTIVWENPPSRKWTGTNLLQDDRKPVPEKSNVRNSHYYTRRPAAQRKPKEEGQVCTTLIKLFIYYPSETMRSRDAVLVLLRDACGTKAGNNFSWRDSVCLPFQDDVVTFFEHVSKHCEHILNI